MDRKRTNILFIVMAVVAIVILIGTGAYAYYQTNINGTTSGTIAKWDFKANNQTEILNLDLGNVYPGLEEIYTIELSAENSELDVYFELRIKDVDYFMGEYMSFISYLVTSRYDYQKYGSIAKGPYGIYGVIPAGETVEIPLVLNWEYEPAIEQIIEYNSELELNGNIEIIAQQYTGTTNNVPFKFYPNDEYYEINENITFGFDDYFRNYYNELGFGLIRFKYVD